MAADVEATKCDVCGVFSTDDSCCGKQKPFTTVTLTLDDIAFGTIGTWHGIERTERPDFLSGRPGSTIRYRVGGGRGTGS